MKNIDFEITRLLRMLGISCGGFRYFLIAIKFLLQNKNNCYQCSEIYRDVAKECQTTCKSVESRMGYSLDKAYNENALQLLNTLYNGEVIRQYKPTVSEFIYLITDYLHSIVYIA